MYGGLPSSVEELGGKVRPGVVLRVQRDCYGEQAHEAGSHDLPILRVVSQSGGGLRVIALEAILTDTLLAAVHTRKTLKNTYQYAGGTVSILLSGAETGGAFSVWEAVQKPGSEPALHVHRANDETFLVLEGEMRVMVGERVFEATAGSVVFAPKGIPHTFKVKSPVVRALTLCTPAGFEEWFRQLGTPAKSFDLPQRAVPPSPVEMNRMVALSKSLQVEILREIQF